MKGQIRFLIISTLLVIGLSKCVEPYETRSISFEKIVVVDGILTNEQGPQRITLSYTTPIDSSYLNPMEDAEVWVETGGGERQNFNETSPGVYESAAGFVGVTGQSYQLFFMSPEGKNYESTIETLIPAPEIDSIYSAFAKLPNDEANRELEGIQFFADSHDETGQAQFFRYEWNETYQIIPDFPSRYQYKELEDIPDTITENMLQARISERTDSTDIATCYRSSSSSGITIQSSVGSQINRVAEVPVRYLHVLEPHLRNRYSIEVTQFAISEGAFNYYRKLKESVESSGSLFDKQQGTIVGNIRCIDDPGETVLGYFEVSGATRKREFFTFAQLDKRFPRPSSIYQCFNEEIYNNIEPIIIGEDTLSIWAFLEPAVDTLSRPSGRYHIINVDYSIGFFMSIAPLRCTACNFFASTKQPEFWERKFF